MVDIRTIRTKKKKERRKLMTLNKVGGEDCIGKVTFESSPAEGEGGTCGDIWEGADQAEGRRVPVSEAERCLLCWRTTGSPVWLEWVSKRGSG